MKITIAVVGIIASGSLLTTCVMLHNKKYKGECKLIKTEEPLLEFNYTNNGDSVVHEKSGTRVFQCDNKKVNIPYTI